MSETPEHRIKRLRMRSMRRGIKEMDLILIAFSDAELAGLTGEEVDLYDRLLSENDHDLYQWVSGQTQTPAPYVDMIARIAARAYGVVKA
ncbi:MAG: succinate dehydrogenase assembly factor 2 [Octadecabacter sp.]